MALLLTKFVFKSSDLENENMMTRTVFDKFEGLLKQFPDKFPRQGNRSWNKIKSVVKAITTSSKPRSPGVITLLAVDETESIAHCMGRVVAQGVQLAYNDVAFVHIQGSEFYKKDSDTVKFHIDSKIKEGLQRGKHVVLVEGLHYLPPSSSLLFHGLCDNENAPFKESVFIFTSKVNEIAANEADQEITKIWKNDISDDQRASLESRIGNTIVIVKPEVEKSFATHCPG